MSTIAPDALLFITPGCPHCPQVLQALADLLKDGILGRLQVVNVAVHPELAAAYHVRSAPWTRIGDFVLEGAQRPADLRRWAELAGTDEGVTTYLEQLLRNGRLADAEAMLREVPERLVRLLPLLAEPESPMQVRLGIGALMEDYAGSAALQALVTPLAALSRHEDHRVRADACHYLALSGSREARPHLERCLGDAYAEVREIAAEGLQAL